jgi:hypothetical protein
VGSCQYVEPQQAQPEREDAPSAQDFCQCGVLWDSHTFECRFTRDQRTRIIG